jgi:hypothetical protein
MSSLAIYLTTYWQPLLVLLAAIILFVIVAFLNWYGKIKENTVRWLATKAFRNKPSAQTSADNLFMVLTTICVAIALVWLGLAFLYLQH